MFNLNETLDKEKAKNISSITIAFVGDAVYSLYVREKLAFNSDSKSGELNKLSSKVVCAVAQAKFVDSILPILSEEETEVYKRARNTKKGTRAKNASVSEYNKSTGFEAVLGFLYITGNYDRLNYILNYNATEIK